MMEENEFRVVVPSPPDERTETIVPPGAVLVALLYKILKSVREVSDAVKRVERDVAQLRTCTYFVKNVEIPETIIELEGRGHLKELLVRSPRDDFRIRVVLDGRVLYSNTYSWFREVSHVVKEFSAVEENGMYVLHISDLKFLNSLRVSIEPESPGRFILSEVYYKLDYVGECV